MTTKKATKTSASKKAGSATKSAKKKATKKRASPGVLSKAKKVVVDVVVGALQRMVAGRVTIHAARIGEDFGGFQKKRLRTCDAIDDV